MLTVRQKTTYNFIQDYYTQHGYAPKLDEIASGIGIRSKGVVHRYLQAIAENGYIELIAGKHRGIRLRQQVDEFEKETNSLPLLGKIAAGRPIEAIPGHDKINMADFFIGPDRFVLRVQGDSMTDAGILDGDMVIIKQQNLAQNGDIVVALIDQDEATLKRIQYNKDGSITLHPAHTGMQAIIYNVERIQIQGIVVGLMRTYETNNKPPGASW